MEPIDQKLHKKEHLDFCFRTMKYKGTVFEIKLRKLQNITINFYQVLYCRAHLMSLYKIILISCDLLVV